MTERVNIWGRQNCDLPSGKLCNSCCVLPEIEFDGVYSSVAKPANSPCPNLNRVEGCDLSLEDKPTVCQSWHCSTFDLGGKLGLIAEGLSLGLVNSDEAVLAALNILKGSNIEEKNFNAKIGYEVLDKSAYLLPITYKRDLRIGDLDET